MHVTQEVGHATYQSMRQSLSGVIQMEAFLAVWSELSSVASLVVGESRRLPWKARGKFVNA